MSLEMLPRISTYKRYLIHLCEDVKRTINSSLYVNYVRVGGKGEREGERN